MSEPQAGAQLEDSVLLRPALQGDVDLLYSSWLHSYWDAEPSALRGVQKAIYFRGQQGVLDELLPRSSIVVACDPKHQDDVFGWVAWEMRAGICVLHYAYVKKTFRRMGLASFLLRHLVMEAPNGLSYTHRTRGGERLVRRYNGVFNPYLSR